MSAVRAFVFAGFAARLSADASDALKWATMMKMPNLLNPGLASNGGPGANACLSCQ
jgi:hypothetical protein